MATTLLLGPVLFESFELPTRISWGGAQRLSVHRLPGGGRVIDAMGRDDAQIAWSGVFTGGEATARARLLDTLRGDGDAWPLTWGSFFYSVVVAEFAAEFARSNWIPYRIRCTVLRDELEAAVEFAASLAGDLLGDLAAAGADASLAGSGLDDRVAEAEARLAGWPGSSEIDTAAALQQAGDAAGQAAQDARARDYLRRAARHLAATED